MRRLDFRRYRAYFMRRFLFIDEVSNKPIFSRLKGDDIGINVTPTAYVYVC